MSYYYLFVCLGLFAIGDFLAVITKARMSSVFTALILFLIGFITGVLPADIIKQAGLSQVALWANAFMVFHMGTLINIKELAKEWRTVALSLVAMAVVILSILAAIPLIGRDAALVSIPVMKGGIIATQIITTEAMNRGLQMAAAFAALLYAIHKFVGTPIASFCGVKEANAILKEYRAGKLNNAAMSDNEDSKETQPLYMRLGLNKFFTEYTCLAITAFFAWISISLGKTTGINYSIWCLILGATIEYFELIPSRILDRAKTSGFMNMVVFAAIIPAMAKVSLPQLVTLSYQMIVIFAVTLMATYLCFYILPFWKIVGSKNLAIGITMANMIGFPATWLVVNEVASAVAANETEKNIVLKKLMPAYVVAGFATVTTLSIIIAGITVKFL